MSPDRPIRVLLVDDHPAVRQGLALLLATESIAVIAEAGSAADARARLCEVSPDLAVLDLSLDGEDGLSLLAGLHRAGIPAVIYSMHTDPRRIGAALAAGAGGYVTKREHHDVLVRAIREVAAGRRFLSPIAAATDSPADLPDLSAQEREVFRRLGEGERAAEIAAALSISVYTVESYFTRLQCKLGLDGMHHLRRRAIQYARHQAG
jgi:DNA-binding NarL/FixJ family response regulator